MVRENHPLQSIRTVHRNSAFPPYDRDDLWVENGVDSKRVLMRFSGFDEPGWTDAFGFDRGINHRPNSVESLLEYWKGRIDTALKYDILTALIFQYSRDVEIYPNRDFRNDDRFVQILIGTKPNRVSVLARVDQCATGK